jgi:UDP-N-acetyl-D-glucosamine dehydrogenase
MTVGSSVDALAKRIAAKEWRVGVIGLGYVGLPLALAFGRVGFKVIGFDIDPKKSVELNAGRSYIHHIPATEIGTLVAAKRFEATSDFKRLGEADALLICVPTPLTRHREPDLSFVTETAKSVATGLRPGHLVVLESTTYPGTTRDVVKPILDATGLACGRDYYLAYSPEREDPGNLQFETAKIPRVIGGEGEGAATLAKALYDAIVPQTVMVSSTATAEAVKLTENIFRAVNIALANELKVVYGAMGIDVWEVIEAAASKPFGYMPFYPGPGLGGHCIPIDPFYLSWKAREFDITTRFIELAGEINTAMPQKIVQATAMAMDRATGRGLKGAKVLVIGVAYKKNVDDMRESPSLKIIELLEGHGAEVTYHDPFIPVIPWTREHSALAGRRSRSLAEPLKEFDVAVISTDHDNVDWKALAAGVPLIVDTRNACARAGIVGPSIVKA